MKKHWKLSHCKTRSAVDFAMYISLAWHWSGQHPLVGSRLLTVLSLVCRLLKAFRGECDSECDDQLQHIITVHIRSRYAEREVDNATIAKAVAADETMNLMPVEHRPAAWFHYAIGNLWLEYNKARGPMNLWCAFMHGHRPLHVACCCLL